MNPLSPSEFVGLKSDELAFWYASSRFQEQEHWMRHSFAVRLLGRPNGIEEAIRDGAANCGPISFAAVTGRSAEEALLYFPEPNSQPWTNRRDMERALNHAGYDYDRKGSSWPTTGLCLIQLKGPWTKRNFAQASLQHTHWIAVLGEYVFDINWNGWLPRADWEEVVLEELMMLSNDSAGWDILTSYELSVDLTWFKQLQPTFAEH